MPAPADAAPPLLLVGAGHAHLHLLSQRARFGDREVCLIDPGSFWYAARAVGVLGGRLAPRAARIEVGRLARRHGVTPIRGRLADLDPERREIRLEDGRRLPFALLSLNLGSTLPLPDRWTPGPELWAAKPLPGLVRLRHRLEAAFRAGQAPRVVVVGGGASGIEIACALHGLARRFGAPCSVTLVTRGATLMADAPVGARRWLARLLRRRGIEVITDTEVAGTLGGGITLRSDPTRHDEDSLRLLAADHVVHAGGLVPPPVVERLGLPLYPGRGIAVEATLQSLAHPDIFATGDCAAMRDHRLPRQVIHGREQAPVLLANLLARLAGRPLTAYRPRPRALAILELGEGLGLAIHGGRWWAGHSALLWKRWRTHRVMRGLR